MLDNTLIVYLSDGAESHHSRCWEWPMVVLATWAANSKLADTLTIQLMATRGIARRQHVHDVAPVSGYRPHELRGQPDPGLKDFDQHGPLEEWLA